MMRDSPSAGAIHFAGRACRLPMADSVAEFADLLYSGTCAITAIPENRWCPDPFLHPVPGVKGKAYTFAAGVLRHAEAFDPAPFGISPREAEYMDPQQRLLLQCVWEALEDACIDPAGIAGTNVGVYVGASMMDHGTALSNDPKLSDGYLMTGSALAVIANRVSHVFDLHGPSMTIDTACSSSLFALEAAAKALWRGEIDTAIVGATNVLMSPAFFIGFSEARMLSPTGLCHAFSDAADGYVRGEGAVAFVMRRQDPGDQPLPRDHGRLAHVGVGTTGRSVNIALPSADAQAGLLERVYAEAGISPDQLAFVEAHGTGTPVGDPIEAEALGRVLGRRRTRPLPIGSVKSNIGHLEPAAGCAGLLKALIALERRRLPASLNAGTLNQNIPFADLNLDVARAAAELDLDDPDHRFAGVSAFGFGGANAHAIVRAPDPAAPAPVIVPADGAARDRIFFTSAFCRDALNAAASAYREPLFDGEGRPDAALFDALAHFRGMHPQRLAVVAEDAETTRAAIDAAIRGQAHPALVTAECGLRDEPPVFLFSGNGAQYPGMSLAAMAADAAFRDRYAEVDAAWRAIAGWSLIQTAESPELADVIRLAEIAQPLLFADQVAMAAALAARGLRPAAVLGHSGGEVAAAAVAGALTLEAALGVIHARAAAQRALAGQGAMAALQVSEAEAAAALESGAFGSVSVSAVNSPRSVSVSGTVVDIEAFQRHVRRDRRWACVRLKVDYAFHHAMQDGTEADFRQGLGRLSPRNARVPFISSVTGLVAPGTRLDADYWWRNVRRPVRFKDAVETAAARGFRCFVEIGPDPVLGAYVRDTLREMPDEMAITHSGARTDGRDVNPVVRAIARVMANGGRVDRSVMFHRPRTAPASLGTYPWQNRDMRIYDASADLKRRAARAPDYHPLLGREVAADARIWAREVDVHLLPEFADHKVAGKALMPGTALAEMALAAAVRTLGSSRVEIRDLDLTAPLPLVARALAEVRTRVTAPGTTIRIASRPRFSEEAWTEHANCRALAIEDAGRGDLATAPDPRPQPDDREGARLYRTAAEIGLDYGPAFRRVEHYRITDEQTIEVVVKAASPGSFALDPIGADAVLHGLIGLLESGRFADRLLGFVPVRIARLSLLRPGGAVRTGRIRVRRIGDRSILADVSLFDAGGRHLAEFEGARFAAARLVQQIRFDRHAFGIELTPLSPPPPAGPAPVDEIAAALNAADRAADGDDAPLLLDAIAHRIAFDALSGFARDRHVALPKAMGQRARQLTATLCNMLSASALIERTDDGLCLAETSELPPASDMIRGLMAERPDLVHECALLARLAEALPDLLAGRLEPDPQAVFGRAAVDGLRSGSALRRCRRNWLVRGLRTYLAGVPAGRPLRVLEVVHDAPVLLDALAEAHGGRIEAYALGSDGRTGAGVRSALGGPGPRWLGPDVGAEAGPFDLIVGCVSAIAGPMAANVPADLLHHLRPGGLAALVGPAPRDHLDLIRAACGLEPFAASRDALEALAAEFAGMSALAESPEGHGCGHAIILGAAPAEEAARVRSNLRTRRDLPEPIASVLAALQADPGDFGGQVSVAHHRTADLWFVAPFRPDGEGGTTAPVVIHAPDVPGDADGVLKERLLCLARIVHAAPSVRKPVWLIAPGGAGAPGRAQSPVQAALWAAFRTAKNEYPVLDLRAVDISPGMDPARAAAMFADLVAGGTDETEIVVEDDGLHALRVRVGPGSPVPAEPARGPVRAVLIDDPAGGLDTLAWRTEPLAEPAPGQVAIDVEATGLNYRDVMWAMGLLPEEALEGGMAGPTLGIECAGRVVACGAGVTGLAPGDRVVATGPASFASRVNVDASRVWPLPQGIPAAAGAGLPVAYFTAHYAICHLARLQPGETVLIHGGAGGVGLAAIEIARALGARIVATAGSEVKRSLLRSLGVPHVLDSRDPAFDAEVRALSGGAGVDVVLNSLSGQMMERSLALVRPFGRFVELGKQDFYGNTPVGLRALKDNVGYFSADLDRLLAEKPELARSLFTEMLEGLFTGRHAPLPVRAFDAAEAVEAFRTMQRSDHVGKIVIRPPDPARVAQPAGVRPFRPHPEGTMVIAGGGGGLGLALAGQMADAGAGTVVLLGRSAAPSPEVEALAARAAGRGTWVAYRCCDIADRAALDRVLDEVRTWGPVTDIVQSAMALEDMRLADLTGEVLERALAAKVAGTRNLDLATHGDPLRTFTVFTSLATLIGNHGQGAYVAANAYMEALIRNRRARGLPGLAIGWGAISDAGYLARNEERARLVRRMGGNVDFGVRQALRAFTLLSAPDQRITADPVIWITPMAWRPTVQGLRLLSGPTYRALRELAEESGAGAESDDLRETLAALEPAEAQARMAAFLRREIARILRIGEGSIATNRPVSDIGVDSLMGVELGLAAQQALGDDVPLMAISGGNTIAEIAERITDHIHGAHGAANGVGALIGDLAAQHVAPSPPSGVAAENRATAAE